MNVSSLRFFSLPRRYSPSAPQKALTRSLDAAAALPVDHRWYTAPLAEVEIQSDEMTWVTQR